MKRQIVVSNHAKGVTMFHCWNADSSFFIYCQRGRKGINNAWHMLRGKYPNLTMSITHSLAKDEISGYYQ